ncbi:MAG: fused MFS/spermidine synthase, partial [Micavibrio aeruginosavorus]|nr:fused MFS/spermidine synthase [Micavibrio aeruginosavorus]
QPITYYSPHGALGDALSLLGAPEQKVSIIGLGVGAIACITRPGRSYDYYEIDPDVVKIAEDRRYFTYLSDCGSPYKTIIGDGRLKMAEAQDGIYDMVIVDAFSSDNIPVHILTLEALQIYSKKLKPGGIMLYHISNRHLDLEPVLKVLARDAGYEAVIKMTPADPLPEDPKILYQKSIYVAMTRSPEQIATLKAKGWEDMVAPEGFRTWTDDYANIAAALRVFQKTPSRFVAQPGTGK